MRDVSKIEKDILKEDSSYVFYLPKGRGFEYADLLLILNKVQ